MVNNISLEVDPSIVSQIVQSINDAVGDKIKEDIRRNELKTFNSIPTRIWDLLNTDLCNIFETPDCMAYITKRGPWQMVMVFEKKTGFLFTFMREKRFLEVQNEVGKRDKMHYVDMLARHLNPDLLAPNDQISFLPPKFNDDEEILSASVKKLLENLIKDGAIAQRHVLVLFESSHNELISIRGVMIDSNLNIAVQKNWSSHIPVQESVVIDQIEDFNKTPSNNPSRNLKFTAKANARQKQNPLKKEEQDIKEDSE